MDYKKISIEDINEDCEEAIISNDYYDAIIEYEGDLTDEIEKYDPECVQVLNDQYAIFHVELINNSVWATLGTYGFSVTATSSLHGPYGKSSMESSGILVFHTHPYLPLTGRGVLVGVIDSGIDYTHRVFTYEDNTTKIASIWDQTIKGNPPEGFEYGTEYLMEDINTALESEEPFSIVPSIDITGHGTFLSGMAAGREVIEEDFVGAAPDAELAIVKLKPAKEHLITNANIELDEPAYQSTDIMLGVKYLIKKANELSKPLVIVIALGSNQTGHDGTSILESYLESIADKRGIVLVTAQGDESNLSHHYRGQFVKNEASKNVDIKVGENNKGFNVLLWSKSPDKLSVAVTSPTGEYISRIAPRLDILQVIQLVLEKTEVAIFYELTESRTGDQLIVVSFRNPTPGIWTITVFGDLIVNGRFDMWLPRRGWVKEDTVFLEPDSYTTVTVPGTSVSLITSGGYNHKTGSLYISSGRGLTREDELKPDIVSPGVKVYGPLPGNKFGTMTGTSISTAITGGASALLLEWGIVLGNDVEMNTGKAKNYLIRGAYRKDELKYPNPEWGYGELNLFSVYESIRGS